MNILVKKIELTNFVKKFSVLCFDNREAHGSYAKMDNKNEKLYFVDY